MLITIRRANTSEWPAIQSLNKMLFDKEYVDFDPTINIDWPFSEQAVEYFQKAVSAEDCFAGVAEVDGKIVGYLLGSINKLSVADRHIEYQAELENMFVTTEFRSLGIGSRLVQEFFTFLRNRGIKHVRVLAEHENSSALEFYRRQGFRPHYIDMEVTL